MKLSKTVKILLASLGVLTIIGAIGISTIVKNNREEANKLEKEKLEQKINNLEEQLNKKEQENIENEDDEKEIKDDEPVTQSQISAMEMYNKAIEEHSDLAINRFFNYYMAIYTTIENNYDDYSAKDMYEVADKFLNTLYGDIKDHGSLSDELLKDQREWVDYKLNNFDKNDYSGLYTYTMNRCKEFIEMYN